jgi:hypothetical protein
VEQLRQHFDSVVVADFEFRQDEGYRPAPSALCWRDLLTGAEGRVRREKLATMAGPPFPVHRRSLFVAHYSVAELSCFETLGWPHPANVVDTWCEEKVRRFGKPSPYGFGLLDCMAAYGLPQRSSTEKSAMQQLGASGGPTSEEQWGPFLAYCAADVDDCAALLLAMLPELDLPRAIHRGRYMSAVASMEAVGFPMDLETLAHLRERWPAIQGGLMANAHRVYGCYPDGHFSMAAFERWLVANRIPWPRLLSGDLDLSSDAFRQQAKAHSAVALLRETRDTLGKTRLFADLPIGPDGRCRTSLRPFASKTSRNQPSNARYPFGTFRGLRSLMKPAPGFGIAYLDFSSQEFLVAAALSGDEKMLDAYASGDVYLAFAKQAGAVPADATKRSHPAERALFKACVLAVQYGMEAESLAARTGTDVATARDLLRLHRTTYRDFWAWSDNVVDTAVLAGEYRTVYGWPLHVPGSDHNGHPLVNARSVRNFPVQANAAEILRVACVRLVGAGVRVCGPVHDAVLLEAPLDELDDVIAKSQQIMRRASAVVLAGPECRVDAAVFRHPDCFVDEAGWDFWQTLLRLAGPVSVSNP